jgi:uncharacterized membrane protein YphA (DoxX/SURF4 family)
VKPADILTLDDRFSASSSTESSLGSTIVKQPRVRFDRCLTGAYSATEFHHDAEESLEHSTLVGIVEAFLRVILGWRFLISGLSNVRRWPNPVNTASILFSQHAKLFGLIATVLMVGGGLGLAAGFQTPISSTMLFMFLIPTFNLHYYWLKVLPTMAPTVRNTIADDKALGYFRNFERQAFHAHEVGIRDNLVLLAGVIYFAVRGSGAYGLDNLIGNWVVWIFR